MIREGREERPSREAGKQSQFGNSFVTLPDYLVGLLTT